MSIQDEAFTAFAKVMQTSHVRFDRESFVAGYVARNNQVFPTELPVVEPDTIVAEIPATDPDLSPISDPEPKSEPKVRQARKTTPKRKK